MRGISTLIPARFVTIIGHLCVLLTLLWESQHSTRLCLPKEFHNQLEYYQNRLVAGLAAAIALTLMEAVTFMAGLTMFSPAVCLLSALAHGLGAVSLTYWALDGWLCDWFWVLFSLCNVLPASVDSSNGEQLTSSRPVKPWSRYLVIAGVVTTLGSSVPVGYNIGVINTPADVIKTFCNESFISRYDVTLSSTRMSVLWSSIVSIFIVGGCIGSLLGALLADRLGRKKATIVTNLLSLAGAVLFAWCRAAKSVEMLLLGRFLVGLSGGLTTSIVPMYLTELSPPSLTGAMGVACPMGVNVGVLVGQLCGLKAILGGPEDWPYLLSVFAILVIVCLPVLFILPESPKYLYIVRRDEETAIKELSKLRGTSRYFLTEDIKLLQWEAMSPANQKWSMSRVLSSPQLRLPLLLVTAMQQGQQISGINAVFYYSDTIFKSAGVSESNSQYATIGCGAINVFTAILMVYLLPRVGRRVLLLNSVLASTCSLAVLAVAMSFMHVSWMSLVCVCAVLTYVLAYGFGLGPIPYFIASEMFEVPPRGAAMALGSLANWGGNFAVGMLFPLTRGYLGAYSFLIFATLTALLYAFLRFYFPETRGKTPAEITQLCSRGFRSRPTRPDDGSVDHYS